MQRLRLRKARRDRRFGALAVEDEGLDAVAPQRLRLVGVAHRAARLDALLGLKKMQRGIAEAETEDLHGAALPSALFARSSVRP